MPEKISTRRGVVIAGASVYNLNNVSDDSMFEPLCRSLRGALGPDAEAEPIWLMCRHPERRRVGDADLRMIPNLDFGTKELSLGKRFLGFNLGDDTGHLREAASATAASRALIIGGDPFIEITLDSFRGILVYAQTLVSLARFLGTPVVLFGIHLGRPPTSAFGADLMSFCLDNASLITTREASVVQRLRELTTNPSILPGADSGFSVDLSLQPSAAGEAFAVGHAAAPYVVATLRSLYWQWGAPEREHFAKIFASALDAAFVEKGLRVALMPHCTYDVDHEWEDDRAMHRLIRSFSARPEAFSLFEEEATVGDALRLHRGARCVVSNRRHAAIFAAQLGVPSVIFGEPGHIQPIHALLSGEAFLSYDGLSAEGLAAAWGRALGSGETGQEAAAAERRKSDRALAELCDYVLAQ